MNGDKQDDKSTVPKLYIVSEGDENLPVITMLPHSFMEFITDNNPDFLLGWGEGCFGVIYKNVLYRSCFHGLPLNSDILFDFYKIAGRYVDEIPGLNFRSVMHILKSLNLSTVEELMSKKEIIDFGLKTGVLRISVNSSEVEDFTDLEEFMFEREMEEVDVEAKLSIEQMEKCLLEKVQTYDECILRHKYGLKLEDYSILSKVDELFSDFDGVEIYQEPRIEDNRVIIGEQGYREPVYLSELFSKLEKHPRIKEFVTSYKSGNVKTYDEFLLNVEKGYDLKALSDLISQGLVYVKLDSREDKIKSYSKEENRIVLIGESGSRFSLRDTIRRKSLKLPLSVSYKKYLSKHNNYNYYVEWKMLDNVKYSTNKAPENLQELIRFVKSGIVKADGKEVKDVKIEGNEVFFIFENGDKKEMYHYVAPQNRFTIYGTINNNLDWVRRFIAEGYKDKNALKLALLLKRYEMGKKVKKLSIRDISRETGISEEQLEIYLRSDLFKRFGELRKGFFYIHPDISEFKKKVQVNRDGNYNVIVVDGRNVMRGGEDKDNKIGKVERIQTVIDYLQKQEVPKDKIVIIVKSSDFNSHRVDDVEKLRELEREEWIKPVSNDYDDKVILRIALEEQNGLIITNDNYGEFVGDNIKKEDIDDRLLKFNFRGKKFNIKREDKPKFDHFLKMMKEKAERENKDSEKKDEEKDGETNEGHE